MSHVIDNLEFGRIPRPSIAHNIDKINELVDYVNENDDLIHNQAYSTVSGNDAVTGDNALANSNAKDFSVHGNTIVENDSLLSVDMDGIEIGNEVCDIPAATYFPNGMRSAGTAYDELTSDKAITRIGEVVFNGTENWVMQSSGLFYTRLDTLVHKQNYINSITCNRLDVINSNTYMTDMSITGFNDTSSSYPNQNWIYIKNNAYTNKDDFKNWLSSNNVSISYELATPTETPIDPPIDTPVIPESQFTAIVEKNNAVPVPFELTYYIVANSTIDNIIARIEALEQGNRTTSALPVTVEKQTEISENKPDIIGDETTEKESEVIY